MNLLWGVAAPPPLWCGQYCGGLDNRLLASGPDGVYPVDGFTPQEKAAMEELCGAMMELLTKPYEQHMIDFLCDAEHYFGMTCDDFAPWEGRVLLILSEDDTTFTPACREDLIALMSSPTVVTDLCGGHLALMVRLEQYADLRRDLSRSVFAKQCAIRIDKQQKERYNNVVIDNDVII